ncbi:hypothetical protein BASA50_002515 [Batrachochytrium salamandrivorans]|uniref:Uncharacterized protein n=1 Tax=Batrachochytrium salamandrivorans TaxID=1357716 RepID=A0ABQ8FL05_9FUNG|nr:hypothetical protein BASA50_002515 [Batrachochytrium salamandrivorans]KAH9275116.1 hypothetical protein BASA83_002340 [Batrachochytrium salamandrivorans]
MKLVSFAVVSFLAATVSAGVSATLGNADYSVHRLEKRDPSEDMQKQLEEEIKHDRKNYEEVREEYLGMKHLEGQLEDDLFQLRFELQSNSYKSPRGDLSHRYNRAQLLYNDQQEACFEKYVVMMDLKEVLQKKVGEAEIWKDNLEHLDHHNRMNPEDPWTVTSPASYNQEILFKQVSGICNSVEMAYKFEGQCKATSEEMYNRLMASGSNKKFLGKQYEKSEIRLYQQDILPKVIFLSIRLYYSQLIWSRRTKQLYRNRYWLTPQIRPKTVKQRHSFALMETLRTCGDSASLQKYVTRQFLDTSGFFKDPSFDQSRAHGTRYLMLARMDALWTARKAIQIGILVDIHPFSVDIT